MKDKIERRSFLGKITFGLSALAALPVLSATLNKEESSEGDTKMETKKKIKKLRALGFQWETLDPFLFCVHHEDFFPKGNENMGPTTSLTGRQLGQDFMIKDGFRMYHGKTVPGFPGHPHRGFETITVVRKGMVDHCDSTGAAGRYGDGDVQWMTAGKGVQHSEMFPLIKTDQDNPLELFQIWLNLPMKSKMVEPHFKMIWSEEVPKYTETNIDKSVNIEVLVGKLGDRKSSSAPPDSWAADDRNEVAIYNVHMEEGTSWTIPATAAGINRTVYFYEGSGLRIDDTVIPDYHAADLDETQAVTFTNEKGTSKILILQGRPINEPVVQHGPFVMNTRQEIQQAFEDYHRTQFGGWPWPKYDHVHPRTVGRFAKHSDGREENRG